MASSSSGGFDLFEALCCQPDLLELVVQQCSGKKNDLRLVCCSLKAAVNACATKLAWKDVFAGTDARFTDFNNENGAKNTAVFAGCPRLQALDFNRRYVVDLSLLAACIGLRRVTGLRPTWSYLGGNLAPFTALTCLEHLECSQSDGLSDISALAACTALKYLDCSVTRIQQLPLLPSLETLICHNTPLTDFSALVAYTALKFLDCSSCSIKIIPPLPASLESLNISGTQCADLSPLAACAGLRSLYCMTTPVQDLAPLATIVRLRLLDCGETLVEDLTPLLACNMLEVLVCDDFRGVINQTKQLLRVRPDLDITIHNGGFDG